MPENHPAHDEEESGVLMAALVGVAMMLQFAAGGPVDDDAPLPPPLVDHKPPVVLLDPRVEALLDCISWFESKHTPSATNRISGAAGQFQFLRSTWATTPEGRRGLSPYDPVAARSAARWMIGQGRKYEWLPVARGLC